MSINLPTAEKTLACLLILISKIQIWRERESRSQRLSYACPRFFFFVHDLCCWTNGARCISYKIKIKVVTNSNFKVVTEYVCAARHTRFFFFGKKGGGGNMGPTKWEKLRVFLGKMVLGGTLKNRILPQKIVFWVTPYLSWANLEWFLTCFIGVNLFGVAFLFFPFEEKRILGKCLCYCVWLIYFLILTW